MAAVKITELKDRATQIMRDVERGAEYVVTKRGRPIAVILPTAQAELEDWILTNHPEAIRRRKEAEARIAAGDFATASALRVLLRRTRQAVPTRR